jgi:reverse gyrase
MIIQCPKCTGMVSSYYIRRYGMCIECLNRLKEKKEKRETFK